MLAALTKSLNKWGFACGRISVFEGRMTPQDTFLSLASLERIEDMFQRLQETPLREHMIPNAVSWEDWSAVIDNYVFNQVVSIRNNIPNPSLADLFLLADDYMNLKRAVQNRAGYPFKTSVFSEARLAEVASGSPNLLEDVVRPAVASLTGIANMAEHQTTVDCVLDGAFLRHYLAIAEKLEIPVILEWAKLRVLSRAIVVLWRAVRAGHSLKSYQQHFLPIGEFNGLLSDMCASPDPVGWGALIPGHMADLWNIALESSEEEQVSKFELLTANYLTSSVRRAKLQTAGPERVAAYLWGLWIESFNFKLVISGKINKLDVGLIKSRIRETYV